MPGSVGSFWRVSASATGPPRVLDRERPGRRRLVGVARPDEPQVRDRPERGVVLDRLVGRPVLAEPDRIVGPDVDDVQTGERSEPDRAAHVVAEGQERRAVRDEPAVIGDPVGRSPPIACSRTPKRRLRPGSSALKFGSPLTSVRFDSDRSAAPPNSSGSRGASAWIASWLALPRRDLGRRSRRSSGPRPSPRGACRSIRRRNSDAAAGSDAV